MGKLFGTDGIRGRVGGEINKDLGLKLGRALVDFCRSNGIPPRILIGRDTRESGVMLIDAVTYGIMSTGGEEIVVGVIPSPGLAFLTKAGEFGLGLMITASHNNASFNGFKIFNSQGEKLGQEEEKKIEELIKTPPPPTLGDIYKSGKGWVFNDEVGKYRKQLLDALPEDFNTQGLRIAIDCAQGATYKIAPVLFNRAGCNVIALNNEPDGKNINENCGSEHPEKIKGEVSRAKAALGLAFDGDGDRVIAIDEKGNSLNGDHLLYIFAKMLKEKGGLINNLVVSTVMSNLGLVNALKEIGISHIYTPVGDHEVFKKMKECGAVLGGEEAGHIIFSQHGSSGDGMLCGLKLLEAIKNYNKPLSELAQEISFYPKLLISVPVKSKPELSSIPEIDKVIKEAENHFGDDGRVIIRYSGTEPLCRVMVEGRVKEEVEKYANQIAEAVKNKLN